MKNYTGDEATSESILVQKASDKDSLGFVNSVAGLVKTTTAEQNIPPQENGYVNKKVHNHKKMPIIIEENLISKLSSKKL